MSSNDLMREALARIEELQERLRAAEAPRREAIAIVGIGCRFPGAAGVDAYWRLLSEGIDAITEIPRSRWDVDACYDADPDAPGKMYTRAGGFLDGIESFDAGFFGMSPREAISLDPQQRLLLETTWEALESAGIPADSLAGARGGVFIGIGGVDYYQRLSARPAPEIDAYMASGNAHSIASGRLSYVLGLQGPSLSVDTACSSSLVALHLACQSLRGRECDVAFAGGVSVILSPAIHFNHCRSRMLSPDGRCKAFDASADGFSRSEGCGVVVLKRLSDAERNGDRILAVIRGSAINQDGRTSALTVPNGPSQQTVLRAALADAGVEPSAISYVEAHGTGTALGDPIEAAALGAVFGSRPAPLAIGSVKTNIGHAEAAAGVAGLIKVVLAMQHRELPPQLHFRRPNPRIDWSRVPVRVVTERTPWPGESVLAGVSSFGFGGTNAHVVLESAPAASPRQTSPASPGTLVLSARTSEALRSVAARYRDVVKTGGDPNLTAICAEAAMGRAHMSVRAAIDADRAVDTVSRLDAIADGRAVPGVWLGEARPEIDTRVVFVYPGQGALRWGMGRGLYESQPVFREAIDRCAAALREQLQPGLVDLLYSRSGEPLIEQTEFAQPALFATEYALTMLWASLGIRPGAVVGHSVGEFAAACAAGVLDVEEACRLVAVRGRLMQRFRGGMAVLGASEEQVRALVSKHPGVEIAALNGRKQVVVTGPRERVEAAIAAGAQQGWRTKALAGDTPTHSALLEPILDEWRAAVSDARFGEVRCDWISTLTGEDVARIDAEYWVRHLRQPVRFAAAAERAWQLGHRLWIEVGPGAGLATLAAEAAGAAAPEGAWIAGLRAERSDEDSMREAIGHAYVAGATIDWAGRFGSRPARVALPTYPFERTRYWIDPPAPEAASATEIPAEPAYELRWEAVAARTGPLPPGSWVVRGGSDDARAAAAAQLTRHGATVVPDLGAAPDLAGVVHLGALDLATAFAGGIDLEDAVVGGVMDAVETSRLAHAVAPAAKVWLITRGAVSVAPPHASHPRTVSIAQASLWGLGQVVALEHPESWGGVLDLDPASNGFDGLEALLAAAGEDQIAVRGGDLLASRLYPASKAVARRTPVYADATYLITGGLGALGLETAGHLASLGARHIVLMGRRAPGESSVARIDELRRRGVTVRVEQADVTSETQMRAAIDRATAEGLPLRGVVHAAGANGSVALADLDAATLRSIVSAKVAGAWTLHEVTRGQPLDFFVGFSSIASVWGSKGQAHYAAANACLDAIVAHRASQGLPALAVQWGPWAAGGMATADAQGWLARVGVQPLATTAALSALESRLSSSGSVVVASVAWPRFLEVYQARRARPLFQVVAKQCKGATNDDARRAGKVARADLIRAQGPEDGRRALTRLVREHVVAVLNLDERRAPAPHQGFFTIGFDSLLALEFKNRLAADLGVALPSTLAFDYPNMREVAEFLASDVLKLDAISAEKVAAPAPVTDASVEATLERLGRLMGKP